MSIKVNLPTIPILDALSLSDKVLIGSSVANGGAARLVSLLTVQAALGAVTGTAVISADNGRQYALVGIVVNGEIAIQPVETIIGSTAGPIINADDGHQYRLVGVVVDGEVEIQTEFVV